MSSESLRKPETFLKMLFPTQWRERRRHFPGGASGKEPACQCRRCERRGFDPRGWEDALEEGMAAHSSIPAWRIHGQRSLAGYCLWGHKELDTTEVTLHTHTERLWTFISGLEVATYEAISCFMMA